MPESLMLSVSGTAETLGISRVQVRRLLARRELEHCRIGRKVLVPRTELEHYIRTRTIPAMPSVRPAGG